MPETTLSIGAVDFAFTVDHTAINTFLNDTTPADKIGPAFNFVMGCVAPDQKAALKNALTSGGEIKGILALQVAGTLVEEGADTVKVAVKKPKPKPSA
ncbi:Phage tail assembly chaperone [Methylomagnum ishizawai]|uniref:Phage tail assembly chaperone n=1 Tax=Methylomagnum ishizawai TaxID=1760988 RepID=A0A1Y6CW16_9GAMM|nr:putative phage tail assembly chaperone [Methylomagnum ishizawai]SMF94430.1 Phage tail assembly chaperone [Methylomagnum ishizawai]